MKPLSLKDRRQNEYGSDGWHIATCFQFESHEALCLCSSICLSIEKVDGIWGAGVRENSSYLAIKATSANERCWLVNIDKISELVVGLLSGLHVDLGPAVTHEDSTFGVLVKFASVFRDPLCRDARMKLELALVIHRALVVLDSTEDLESALLAPQCLFIEEEGHWTDPKPLGSGITPCRGLLPHKVSLDKRGCR